MGFFAMHEVDSTGEFDSTQCWGMGPLWEETTSRSSAVPWSGRISGWDSGERWWLRLGVANYSQERLGFAGHFLHPALYGQSESPSLLVPLWWMCLWTDFQESSNSERLDSSHFLKVLVVVFAETVPWSSGTWRMQRWSCSGIRLLSSKDGPGNH